MKSTFSLFLLITLISCTSNKVTNNYKVSKSFNSDNSWVNYINDQAIAEDVYVENAVLIDQVGNVFESPSERLTYLNDLKKSIGEVIEINTIYTTPIRDSISYEIGDFSTKTNDKYYHLLINRTRSGSSYRELEAIFKSSHPAIDTSKLNQARQNWILLCNQHIPQKLVEEMYEPEAIYYNHKPVIKGTTSITKEYSYMSQPQYNLLLTPLQVTPVNQNIIFEIGQCSGSYGGKYMLLWRKDQYGNWKVLMDSNL